MIDQQKVILVTLFHITLLDENFDELQQLMKRSLHV